MLDCAVELAEVVLANLSRAQQETDRELRIVRRPHHLLVDSSQRIRRADRGAEPLHLFLRLRMPRVLPERPRVALEGTVQLAERELLQLGDFVEELQAPLGRGRVMRLNLVDVDQPARRAAVAVDRLEDVGHRGLVLG